MRLAHTLSLIVISDTAILTLLTVLRAPARPPARKRPAIVRCATSRAITSLCAQQAAVEETRCYGNDTASRDVRALKCSLEKEEEEEGGGRQEGRSGLLFKI